MFTNVFGLINPTSKDIVSENCMLTTIAYYYLLRERLPSNFHKVAVMSDILLSYARRCKKSEGLYHQYPENYHVGNPKDRYMSPDQLIAITAILRLNGFWVLEVGSVRDYLEEHDGNYNNLEDGTKRYMQPAARYFPAALLGRTFPKMIIYGHCIFTAIKNRKITGKASGLQKVWVILNAMKAKKMLKFCEKLLKGTWSDMFVEYYREQEHPIRLLLER